jgi:Tfp pilus assembly protein PilN
MKPFNLLQYPALASQRRRFHSRWTLLSGLLAGSLGAVWLISEVQEKRLQRVQETASLQSHLKQLQNQLAADKMRQAQQNTWLHQDARIKALTAQQRSWDALHEALLQESGPDTVQLLRLELDAQTLELAGQAKDVRRMALARARLSKPLSDPPRDNGWTLVSMMNAPGSQGLGPQAPLEFVWQAAWPQLGSGSVATSPARPPQSDSSEKGRP